MSGLQSAGHLVVMAGSLANWFDGNIYGINIVVDYIAIVDNVPLVAGLGGPEPVFLPKMEKGGTGGRHHYSVGGCCNGIREIDFVWYLKDFILALVDTLLVKLIF